MNWGWVTFILASAFYATNYAFYNKPEVMEYQMSKWNFKLLTLSMNIMAWAKSFLLLQIAGKVNKIIRELGLRELGQLEQDLVFGDAGMKDVIKYLTTKEVRSWRSIHETTRLLFIKFCKIHVPFFCRIQLVKISCACWWFLQPFILRNLRGRRVTIWWRLVPAKVNYHMYS